MDLKSLVKSKTESRPPRIVVHGIHGVGKSYFASNAPDPIFLITEDGLTSIEVDHFPLAKSLDEVWQYMGAIIEQDHQYKTFVVDTIDWLEKLIFAKVCQDKGVDTPEDIGYGKAYVFAMKYWEKFLNGLNKIREKNIAIILLAHNEIKTFNPPDNDPYDRYQIKLHRHAATAIEEWADAVLFANFRTVVTKDKGTQKTKAVGSGERVLYSSNRPAYRAKSRYAIPDEIPLEFSELMRAIKGENTTNNTEERKAE